MLDARVFWNQYFANQTGHLGRSNGLMMTLVTDWEEALMLRRYMWFGWGSCSFPLWRHGHKHSHTNTVSGDDMPKPLRVQSSNNVVMSKRSNGSKTSYCSEIWRENKAVFFLCEISCYLWPLLALHFSRTSPQTIQNVHRTANAIRLQVIPIYLGGWGAPLVLFQSADYINGPVLLLNELGYGGFARKVAHQQCMLCFHIMPAYGYDLKLVWWKQFFCIR